MRIPIQNAPHLIEHYFGVMARAKVDYEKYMERVDSEPNPDVRKSYERMAVSSMNLANAMKSDAEDLLRQWEAAGGTVERSPAWGPAIDWIFTLTPRR